MVRDMQNRHRGQSRQPPLDFGGNVAGKQNPAAAARPRCENATVVVMIRGDRRARVEDGKLDAVPFPTVAARAAFVAVRRDYLADGKRLPQKSRAAAVVVIVVADKQFIDLPRAVAAQKICDDAPAVRAPCVVHHGARRRLQNNGAPPARHPTA